MYITAAGFETRLTEYLFIETNYLPVPQVAYTHLLHLLDNGDHTYLCIKDGNAEEYVRVKNVCDRLVLFRGEEGTTVKAFPCGSLVTFAMTKSGVEAQVCQMAEEDCNG